VNKKFSVISLITLFALVLSPISATAASSSMNTNQKKYVTELFKAFASSDADKIAIAQRKYVSSGSAADKFTNLVKNHHSTTKYFKSINAYGISTGVAPTPDAKGTYKVGTTYADFNSVVNEFDSYNTKFTFDKKGKIKSWTMAKRDKKSASKLDNRINALTSTFNNANFSVSSGYIFKQPDGDAFLQLLVKNVSGNLKSWSYTGGQFGDPSASYFDADSSPAGCLYPGQEAFLEAQINGLPQIVKNTESVFDAPTLDVAMVRQDKVQLLGS
jgi:hypothetical protein